MVENSRILVTGGAGCIGSTLVDRLCQCGNKVVIYDNLMRGEESKKILKEVLDQNPKNCIYERPLDILNTNDLKNEIKKTDMIFHLAALPSHRRALEEPRSYAETDVMGTINVLEAVRQVSKDIKVIFSSSNKVYGKQIPPFEETMLPMPCGPYGMAKYNSEQWCQLYQEYYGINVSIARLFHVIGPRTQPDREISIFTESIIKDKEIYVHGIFDKDNRFISCAAGYTNVYDTVNGLILLMEKCRGFDIYNIGSEKETSVERLAILIEDKLGKRVNINHREIMQHESLRHAANNEKIKSIGWKQNYSVEDSINQYVDWRLSTGSRNSFYV